MNPPPENPPRPVLDEVREVGRGGMLLSLSKIYFMASSYGILVLLGIVGGGGALGNRLLADYKLVNGWLSLFGTVLVTGTVQAVSRFVGKEPGATRGIMGRMLQLQIFFGGTIALGYFLMAPVLAKKAPELVVPMRISALVPLIYAFYSVFMGTLNGRRRFLAQAQVDMVFTTLKVVLVALLAWIFSGSTEGAFAGFAAAALLACGLGILLARRDLPASIEGGPTRRTLMSFQLQTVIFMLLVQWVVQMDQWYVVWFGKLSNAAVTVKDAVIGTDGSVLTEAVTVSAQETARQVYALTQTFATVSYSSVVALTFVMFPLLTKTSLVSEPDRARGILKEALRYGFIIVFCVAAVLSTTPQRSLELLLDFKPMATVIAASSAADAKILNAAPHALTALGFAYVAMAVLFILASALTASGRPRTSIGLFAAVAVLQVSFGAFLTPWMGPLGQGLAGLLAHGTGCVIAVIVIRRLVGSFLPLATLARVFVATGVVALLGLAWAPPGKVITLIRFILYGLVFLGVLAALGEIKKEDVARLKRVFASQKT